jgi:hypothetical protein
MDGKEDEFWQLKPDLTAYDVQLINAFWRARRECDADKPISRAILKQELQTCRIEEDIGLFILQGADDHYLSLYAEKLKKGARS